MPGRNSRPRSPRRPAGYERGKDDRDRGRGGRSDGRGEYRDVRDSRDYRERGERGDRDRDRGDPRDRGDRGRGDRGSDRRERKRSRSPSKSRSRSKSAVLAVPEKGRKRRSGWDEPPTVSPMMPEPTLAMAASAAAARVFGMGAQPVEQSFESVMAANLQSHHEALAAQKIDPELARAVQAAKAASLATCGEPPGPSGASGGEQMDARLQLLQPPDLPKFPANQLVPGAARPQSKMMATPMIAGLRPPMSAGLVAGGPGLQRPGLMAPMPAKQSLSSLTGKAFGAIPPKIHGSGGMPTGGLIIGGRPTTPAVVPGKAAITFNPSMSGSPSLLTGAPSPMQQNTQAASPGQGETTKEDFDLGDFAGMKEVSPALAALMQGM